jgi:hypothetical protein
MDKRELDELKDEIVAKLKTQTRGLPLWLIQLILASLDKLLPIIIEIIKKKLSAGSEEEAQA